MVQIRNQMYEHDLHCALGPISWSHIRACFEYDSTSFIRLTKLSEEALTLNSFTKMNTRLMSLVFCSKTVRLLKFLNVKKDLCGTIWFIELGMSLRNVFQSNERLNKERAAEKKRGVY